MFASLFFFWVGQISMEGWKREVDGWVGNYGMIWVMCEELLKGMDGRGWRKSMVGERTEEVYALYLDIS
jgi:hypothetical protein